MHFEGKRPPKRIEVLEVREVSVEEVKATPRGRDPAFKKIRDHHHRLARMAAWGLSAKEIAVFEGLSETRTHMLVNDPSFRELVAWYRGRDDEGNTRLGQEPKPFSHMETFVASLGVAARIQNEQLSEALETGEKIPHGTLSRVIADLADRTGFGRHQTVSIDHSFSARLDRAIERSGLKQIEGRAEAISVAPTPQQLASSVEAGGDPEVEVALPPGPNSNETLPAGFKTPSTPAGFKPGTNGEAAIYQGPMLPANWREQVNIAQVDGEVLPAGSKPADLVIMDEASEVTGEMWNGVPPARAKTTGVDDWAHLRGERRRA